MTDPYMTATGSCRSGTELMLEGTSPPFLLWNSGWYPIATTVMGQFWKVARIVRAASTPPRSASASRSPGTPPSCLVRARGPSASRLLEPSTCWRWEPSGAVVGAEDQLWAPSPGATLAVTNAPSAATASSVHTRA